MPEQQKIILCQSVRVMQRPVAVSQAGKCFDCDIQIWLAPSSVNLLISVPGLKTLCELCSAKFMESQDEQAMFALAPGALQEALAELKKVHSN